MKEETGGIKREGYGWDGRIKVHGEQKLRVRCDEEDKCWEKKRTGMRERLVKGKE